MAFDKERVRQLMTQDKTPEVVEQLIKLNEGLIGAQLKKFNMIGNPDAISVAYEALYNAILTYNANKNSAFSTYATICIYNRLGSLLRTMNAEYNLNTISYDVPMPGSDNLTYLDQMESPKTADTDIMEQCGISNILRLVDECYKELKTPMHREIITLWKTSNFKMFHGDIAVKLKCSQSYVTQVINKFRKNLKKKLEAL